MPSAGRHVVLGILALALCLSPADAEPVRYRIEPAASEITFRATSRLQTADGRFPRFRGELHADPSDPKFSINDVSHVFGVPA